MADTCIHLRSICKRSVQCSLKSHGKTENDALIVVMEQNRNIII